MVSNPNHHPTTHQCLTGKLRCHVVEGGQLRGDVVDMSQLRCAQPLWKRPWPSPGVSAWREKIQKHVIKSKWVSRDKQW